MSAAVWADHAAVPTLAPLPSSASADAVVVGLGASGLAAVDALLDRGCNVIGIDAGGIAGGAAGRNGGFLLGGLALFHHDAVARLGATRATAAYRATLQEIDLLAERWPDLVRRTGSLRVAAGPEEEADCAAHLASMRESSLAAEPYDGPAGAGIWLPDDAVVQPLERCAREATAMIGRGARLHGHTIATALEPGRVVTDRGAIDAPWIVVCVDGGLERVVPSLAARVRSTRLQMLATAPATDVEIPFPVYRRWGYDYFQQLPDGRLAVGGGRDLHEAAEWGAPAVPAAPVQDHLDHLLRNVIKTAAEVTHRWAGVVAYTADRLPLVEVVADGVAAAGAYSGHGNLLGSMCGRGAVELLADGVSPIAALLRPPTLSA